MYLVGLYIYILPGISFGDKGGRCIGLTDNLATFMYRVSGNSKSFHLLKAYGSVQTCIGKPLPLYKDSDIVADIKKKRFDWIRHLVRMDHGWLVKKISESKLERRRIRRSKLKSLEDIEKALRKMKVKRWRQKAEDREEWASVND